MTRNHNTPETAIARDVNRVLMKSSDRRDSHGCFDRPLRIAVNDTAGDDTAEFPANAAE
jgi:hypothetical protein